MTFKFRKISVSGLYRLIGTSVKSYIGASLHWIFTHALQILRLVFFFENEFHSLSFQWTNTKLYALQELKICVALPPCHTICASDLLSSRYVRRYICNNFATYFFLQDRVFGKESKTIDLYDDFAKPVVRAVMEGINGMKDKRLDSTRMI